MKTSLRIFLCLFWAVTFGMQVSATTGRPLFLRTVHIAGIITDAASFSPLDNAKVYDDKGSFIASTDAKGYFNGTFRIAAEGEVRFRIKIGKKGLFFICTNRTLGRFRKFCQWNVLYRNESC